MVQVHRNAELKRQQSLDESGAELANAIHEDAAAGGKQRKPGIGAANVNITGVKFKISEAQVIKLQNIWHGTSSGFVLKVKRQIRKQQVRFFITLFLVLLHGVTWTVGIVAVFAELPDLWYFFIILEGMQVIINYKN